MKLKKNNNTNEKLLEYKNKNYKVNSFIENEIIEKKKKITIILNQNIIFSNTSKAFRSELGEGSSESQHSKLIN